MRRKRQITAKMRWGLPPSVGVYFHSGSEHLGAVQVLRTQGDVVDALCLIK